MTEVPSFYNVEFPMDYPIIAPFYADIDIRKAGQVADRTSRFFVRSGIARSLNGPFIVLVVLGFFPF
jgi:hypothetical protein